eukprot:scaffold744_cov370-Prasinococcus_capsulatus_cf.AAC.8
MSPDIKRTQGARTELSGPRRYSTVRAQRRRRMQRGQRGLVLAAPESTSQSIEPTVRAVRGSSDPGAMLPALYLCPRDISPPPSRPPPPALARMRGGGGARSDTCARPSSGTQTEFARQGGATRREGPRGPTGADFEWAARRPPAQT